MDVTELAKFNSEERAAYEHSLKTTVTCRTYRILISKKENKKAEQKELKKELKKGLKKGKTKGNSKGKLKGELKGDSKGKLKLQFMLENKDFQQM